MKKSLAACLLCLSVSLSILSALPVSVFAQQQKPPASSKPVVVITQAETPDSRQQQQQQKPVTNSDIIRLVKAGFGESVVINYIQTNQSRFDVSLNALIELKNSGVSQKVIETMQFMAAAGGGGGAKQPAQKVSGQSSASNQSLSQQPPLPSSTPDFRAEAAALAARPPSAYGQQFYTRLLKNPDVKDGDEQFLLQAVPQIVQTKEKTGDLASIARDKAIDEAISHGTTAAISAAGAAAIGSSVPVFGGIIQGGMMAGNLLRKKPTATYVTAIGGQSSPFVPQTDSPKFEVVFGNVAGVNPEEYEPAIVRLIPTANNWRLVYAKKAKQGYPATGGRFYSDFTEERVSSRSVKLGRGDVQIEAEKPLPAGEYAVVLRPVSQEKTYSMKETGDFEGYTLTLAVWDFAIRNPSGAAQNPAAAPIAPTAISPSAIKSQAASQNSNSRNPQANTQAESVGANITSRSSNGVTITINGSYDRTFETALNFLKRQGNTIESASREAGQIITQMTNSGGYHQTGRHIQITFIKEGESTSSSFTMRVAVLEQKRYKALRTEAWSDARLNAEESNKMADELLATLLPATAVQ